MISERKWGQIILESITKYNRPLPKFSNASILNHERSNFTLQEWGSLMLGSPDAPWVRQNFTKIKFNKSHIEIIIVLRVKMIFSWSNIFYSITITENKALEKVRVWAKTNVRLVKCNLGGLAGFLVLGQKNVSIILNFHMELNLTKYHDFLYPWHTL